MNTIASPSGEGLKTKSVSILVENGSVRPVAFEKSKFIESFPRGAFTTARTFNQSSIFQFDLHVQRLVDSGRKMMEKETEETEGDGEAKKETESASSIARSNLTPEKLRPLLVRDLRKGLEALGAPMGGEGTVKEDQKKSPSLRANGDIPNGVAEENEKKSEKERETEKTEFQITTILTWKLPEEEHNAKEGIDLVTFIQQMPLFPPTIQVEARRAERTDPSVKDSQWVFDRRKLEEMRAAETNEVLMVNSRLCVTEGLSSNFFAVVRKRGQDGKECGGIEVQTAPDDEVLAGTVRATVFEACEKLGLPVVKRSPRLDEADQWDSCMVTSTSRLCLPVSRLLLPSEEKFNVYLHATGSENGGVGGSQLPSPMNVVDFPDGAVAKSIAEAVKGLVEEESTDLRVAIP